MDIILQWSKIQFSDSRGFYEMIVSFSHSKFENLRPVLHKRSAIAKVTFG